MIRIDAHPALLDPPRGEIGSGYLAGAPAVAVAVPNDAHAGFTPQPESGGQLCRVDRRKAILGYSKYLECLWIDGRLTIIIDLFLTLRYSLGMDEDRWCYKKSRFRKVQLNSFA